MLKSALSNTCKEALEKLAIDNVCRSYEPRGSLSHAVACTVKAIHVTRIDSSGVRNRCELTNGRKFGKIYSTTKSCCESIRTRVNSKASKNASRLSSMRRNRVLASLVPHACMKNLDFSTVDKDCNQGMCNR